MMRYGAIAVLLTRRASSKVIGAAFLPHGDFCFDPSLVGGANGTTALRAAAAAVGDRVAAARPDVVFLSTPHGEAADVPFLFLDADVARGTAEIGLDLDRDCAYGCYEAALPVDVQVARNVTRDAVDALRRRGLDVVELNSFQDLEPAALRWGETIPLSFLNATLNSTRLVVLGQPTRRQTDEVAMAPEEAELGKTLFEFFEALPERVFALVSGDLAHTHLASGPYGYSPAAEPFDEALGAWAASLDPRPLTKTATALADDAKSCGYTGAMLLDGFLDASAFAPRLLAIAHPTYYGMMVADFWPLPHNER